MFNFDKKDIISWANCEEAEKYLGKEGYSGDTLVELGVQIQRQNLSKLERIDASDAICFHTLEYNDYGDCIERAECLFLPADKVKQPEPKIFRPYTDINEFQNNVGGLSETVLFRSKNDKEHMYKALIVGFDFYTKIVCLSYYKYSLKELFDRFEWFNCRKSADGEWQPFGVEK